MNKVFYLGYSHDYNGLCNQLYHITNAINEANKLKMMIYIESFNIDIFKSLQSEIEKVIDIDETNKKMESLGLFTRILKDKVDIENSHIQKVPVYPVENIEILKALTFNSTIIEKANSVKDKLGNDYYSIHFRLDIDCIISKLYGTDVLNSFLKDNGNKDNLINVPIVDRYCEYLLIEYLKIVELLGFDKKYYICTPIGKWEIHSHFEKYLNRLINYISTNSQDAIVGELYYKERELNALVELIILRDSSSTIVFEGSTFSEGYSLKVNDYSKKYYTVIG